MRAAQCCTAKFPVVYHIPDATWLATSRSQTLEPAMRPTTFETTYPQMPFAPLVALALAIAEVVARKRHGRPTPHAAPANA